MQEVAKHKSALNEQLGLFLQDDVAVLAGINQDFGHLTAGSSSGLVQPDTTEALVRLIIYANKNKLSLTIRGAGMSQSGQSIGVDKGWVVSLSAFSRIDEPNLSNKTITCGAGARLGDVVDVILKKGLIPFVLPLNLDMSVGGLLSVGGIGASSHSYGPFINHVESITVVTGAGDIKVCTRTKNAELFDATLAGLGRCAVITEVTIALRALSKNVKTFYVLYDDLDACLRDQQKIVDEDRADYLEVFCSASIQGLRNTPQGRLPFVKWLYPMQLSFEYDEVPPTKETALAGLSYWQAIHEEESAIGPFTNRFQSRFDVMRQTGGWDLAHPWLECLLPADQIAMVLPDILSKLPVWLGDMHRLFHVAKPYANSSAFKMPAGDQAIAFAILPMGIADHFKAPALAVLREVHDRLMEVGGKRYTSGWLGMMDQAAWQSHYDDKYESWVAAKTKYDPHGVLQSALFF